MLIVPKYYDLLFDKTPHLVLYGGASSGKSVFCAQKIIARIKSEYNHRFLILRKIDRTIRHSVYDQLRQVIYSEGLENEFIINKSEYDFTHLSGNQILCKGLDDPMKLKSITGISGVWMEETTEFTNDDIDQIILRIRGIQSNYTQYLYSFNPVDEDNQIVRRFLFENRADTKVIHTTYKDNPYLTEQDHKVIEGYKFTNSLYYDVYCLGIPGVVDKSNKFLYAFNKDLHIKPVQIKKNEPIWLSFDFNKDPITCIVAYRIDNKTVKIFNEFKLQAGSTPELCDLILASFPNSIFYITGDASGNSRSSLVRGNITHYFYIRQILKVSNMNMRVRSANISHHNSRLLCNSVLQHAQVNIDPKCENLIRDCIYAKIKRDGDINEPTDIEIKKDRGKNKNDFLDCFRYLLDAIYPTYLNKIHRNNVKAISNISTVY